jgi:uncharacterized protein (TIRG00374 family)
MSFHTNPSFRSILKIAFSLLILLACFLYIDVSKLPEVLVTVHLGYLFLALILNIIGSIIIPALITKEALRTDRIALSLSELIKINFSIRFFTLIFPRGVATGVRWHKYKKSGSGQDAFALIVFEKLVQILILLFTASLFLGIDKGSLPEEGSYIWIASLLALSVITICIMPFLSYSFSCKFHRLLNIFQNTLPQFIYTRLIKIWDAVCAFQKLKSKTILFIIGLSLFSYLFFILSPYILSFAMGIDISLKGIAWIRSLVMLFALIPVTIAGLGIREAGYVAFMQLYGIANYEALGFALMLFAIQIMIGAIGAIIEIWNHYIKSFIGK